MASRGVAFFGPFIAFIAVFCSWPAAAEPINTVSGVVTIVGEQVGDKAGFAVAGVGDVNGDGFGDLLIGAPDANANGKALAGKVYLIYGSDSLADTIVLPPAQDAGVIFLGAKASDNTGFSVARAGDVNGDGRADLLIGAPGADPGGKAQAGVVYLAFGATTLAHEIDLAEHIFMTKISGANPGDQTGLWVAPAGNINNDGLDDVLIGAPQANAGNINGAGKAYLVYGSAELRLAVDLGSLGNDGTEFLGTQANEQLGTSATGLGDVDHDGNADIIIGAPGASGFSMTDVGASYLVFGQGKKFATSFDLKSISSSTGFVFRAADHAGEVSGQHLSAAGDVNRDNNTDILISAPLAGPGNLASAGAVFLVYGRSSFPTSSGQLRFNDSPGVIFTGADAGDQAGSSAAGIGFFNDDQFADLVIGAHLADAGSQANAGKAYLVLGGNNLPTSIKLGPNVANVQQFEGESANDQFGTSVDAAGDVDGDLSSDIIFGAPGARGNKGAAYVLFGTAPASAASLQLDGPDWIIQQRQASFTASLILSNGFTTDVSAQATWGVDDQSLATVDQVGTVQAKAVSSNQSVALTVSFQHQGQTLQASKNIEIRLETVTPLSCFAASIALFLAGSVALRFLRN